MKVYLAGPITGLTYEGANDWRVDAHAYMDRHGMTALSPLRTGEAEFNGPNAERVKSETMDIGPMFTDNGIMVRDHWDVSRCDCVLAYLLGAPDVSVGTVMELGWAYAYRKPLIVVMEKDGNPHDHPMVRAATDYRVDSLMEALAQLDVLKEA